MARDFTQLQWDEQLRDDCRAIVRLAIAEDLQGQQDWTSVALVPKDRRGTADIVAREVGIVAGMPTLEVVIEEFQADLTIESYVADGDEVSAGTKLVTISGSTLDLLTAERTMLNFTRPSDGHRYP